MNLNVIDRSGIKKYFYGTKGPLILATIAIVFEIFTVLFGGVGRNDTLLFLIMLIAAGVWALVERFGMKASQEQAVDQCIKNDINNFSERALEKLGLISEQVNMIDPISVLGPYYGYVEVKLKRSIFTILFRAIYELFTYKPKLIFKYGSDDKVRYSLVQAHLFFFSESQIYVYVIDYDICTGEIFEESTAEYFYRDVDCVITGEKTEKIISKRKLISKKFEYFKVIVTSGTSTHAIADVEVSILDSQVKAMRSLIRSKKEEGLGI